jgi:hypothetical protein
VWWKREEARDRSIGLTPEDWQRADESLARDPREFFRERIARQHAQERIAREQRERRRRRINRLTFGLFARD